MRLAAMYSGGKDSTFAMYLAKQMGHEIPYIVSIVPEAGESWIFHVPNLDIVPLMAEAMEVELVKGTTDGTEAGDMVGMRQALEGLDIDGIVTGAVWSDYQWDRMNLVCGDLGLKVITPLWRKDQDMILDEMISSGIKAVIVGCYAEGLGEEWLGREIDVVAAKELREIRSRTSISVMGEGGEYESMTLDSPMHKHPIVITGSEKVWRNGSGTLTVTEARLA